jgi:hypothetical protein
MTLVSEATGKDFEQMIQMLPEVSETASTLVKLILFSRFSGQTDWRKQQYAAG